MTDKSTPGTTSPGGKIPAVTLREMYLTMLRIRRFEEKVAELLLAEPPEIKCPVHLYTGQEAVATGVCASLRRDDYVFSTHRSHGHFIAKGGNINALMAELYGRETGTSRGRGGSMHLAQPDIGFPGSSAIVAGTIPLAVGVALAFSIRKKDSVAVAFFGDGAVGEGVFYESLNFASLRKLPVIFVCENNLYSTHLPIRECMADTEIYKKAGVFNMPGIRVDGNNVTEVYQSAKEAIENARSGKGPALLECLTYRWRGHVGPNYDIDKGLRSQIELDSWVARDPVNNLEQYLLAQNMVSGVEVKSITRQVDKELEDALVYAKNSPYPECSELTANVFAD